MPLVRAAIEVIAEKALSGTRVGDIGKRAGMSPGHVLYYFDGKSEIFTRGGLERARGTRLGVRIARRPCCARTRRSMPPLTDVAGGVDLSFLGGAVTAALAYLALRALVPEGDGVAVQAPAEGRVTV